MAGRAQQVSTAETSESVTNVSADSEATAEARAAASVQPPVQGHGKTVWDNPEQDPNHRRHVGEDPDGEDNAEFKSGKEAVKAAKKK